MQLSNKSYGYFFNKLFVKYHRSADHPFKLRIISFIEKIIGQKRLVVNTRFNFIFSIDKADLIQKTVLEELVWEEELTRFFEINLTPKDIFFDIGANVGYFSCLALSNNVTKVVSFDPDPLNTQIIEFNFNLNKFDNSKYLIFNLALGENNTKSIFYRGNTANTGISGLVKNYEDAYESQFEVIVNSLDSLIIDGLISPTVLKIDTEGYELNILSGAKNLLKNKPPRIIVFEANSKEQYQNIKEFLVNYGYDNFRELKDQHGLNYIALLKV